MPRTTDNMNYDHEKVRKWLSTYLDLRLDSTDRIRPADPAKWLNFMIYCFKKDAGTLESDEYFLSDNSYSIEQNDVERYKEKYLESKKENDVQNHQVFAHWKNRIERQGMKIASTNHDRVVEMFMRGQGITDDQIEEVLSVNAGSPPLLYHLVEGEDPSGKKVLMCQCWLFFPINNQNPVIENLIKFTKIMSFVIFPIGLGFLFFKKFVLKDRISGNLKKFFDGNAGFHHADYEGFTLTFQEKDDGSLVLKQLECHQHGIHSQHEHFNESNQPNQEKKLRVGFAANGHPAGTQRKFWYNKHLDRSDMEVSTPFEPTDLIDYTQKNLPRFILPKKNQSEYLEKDDFINLGAQYPIVQRFFLYSAEYFSKAREIQSKSSQPVEGELAIDKSKKIKFSHKAYGKKGDQKNYPKYTKPKSKS